MLWGLMGAIFWVIVIATLIWIFSKPKLRKKYSLFSILFAALALGIIAAVFVLIAYLAIIIFVIMVIILAVGFAISAVFRKKRK